MVRRTNRLEVENTTDTGDLKFPTRSSDPTTPSEGEMWYNSTDKAVKIFDGTQTSAPSRLINDPSPELAAELDASTNTIGYSLLNNGSSGTSKTLDWRNSNKQKLTLTGNCTLSFTAPSNTCAVQLILVQDATGGRTVTWPTNVLWVGSAPPALTSTANGIDIISMLYDGTYYYAAASLNFG